MRKATNDNATARHRSAPPITFGCMYLDDIDIDVDVSGARSGSTLDVITSHQQTLDRPTRLSMPHSLAQGLHYALAGQEWQGSDFAYVVPDHDLILVVLAKRPDVPLITLVLTRDEAREFKEILTGSAGRPHWSRFTARGYWQRDVPAGIAA